MKITSDFELKLFIELDYYMPGREAPACSNPSSLTYSDPGDDPEFEYTVYLDEDMSIEAQEYIYELYANEIAVLIDETLDGNAYGKPLAAINLKTKEVEYPCWMSCKNCGKKDVYYTALLEDIFYCNECGSEIIYTKEIRGL